MTSTSQSSQPFGDIFGTGANNSTGSGFSLASVIPSASLIDSSALFEPVIGQDADSATERIPTAPLRKYDFSGLFADFKQINCIESLKMDAVQLEETREALQKDREIVRELVYNRVQQVRRNLRRKQFSFKTSRGLNTE